MVHFEGLLGDVWVSGFRGLGFRGLGFRGLGVWGLGCRVSGFRIYWDVPLKGFMGMIKGQKEISRV